MLEEVVNLISLIFQFSFQLMGVELDSKNLLFSDLKLL
jgi:hypothetical protein